MNEVIRVVLVVLIVSGIMALAKAVEVRVNEGKPVPEPEPVETYDECVERLMQEYCDIVDTDVLVGFRIACSPVPEAEQCSYE